MALSREQILAARADRKPVALEVEEWGGTVYMKHLTVQDQIALAESNEPSQMPVAVLIAALVDENEQPIFQPSDRDELAKEAFTVVLKVFSEVARLNGLTTKELDEAMEAFVPARSESGPIESPSLSADPSQNSEISPVLS